MTIQQNNSNLVSSVNPRAKRLSLRVDQSAGVIKLTIPKWTTKWKIERFLKANEDWIADKSALLLPKIEIKHGTMILFQGVEHQIVIEHHNKRTTEISILPSPRRRGSFDTNKHTPACAGDTDMLLIKTSRDDPTSNLKRWMIDECRTVIEPMAHKKASIIGKSISKIDLRDTKSRWGSCSTDKRLMLSWRLMMAPPEILDYVVAHEVAHLKHMDHSKKFWDACYDLTEGDADDARQWLRDNGNQLMRWF